MTSRIICENHIDPSESFAYLWGVSFHPKTRYFFRDRDMEKGGKNIVSITAAVRTYFRALRADLLDRSWLILRTELLMAKIRIKIEPVTPANNHLTRADCLQRPWDNTYFSRVPNGCPRLGAITDRRERR